jgi:hypothetical protein
LGQGKQHECTGVGLYNNFVKRIPWILDHDALVCDALCHACTFRAHADGVPSQE